MIVSNINQLRRRTQRRFGGLPSFNQPLLPGELVELGNITILTDFAYKSSENTAFDINAMNITLQQNGDNIVHVSS